MDKVIEWLRTHKPIAITVAAVLVIFGLANAGVWAYSRGRTYPGVEVARRQVGNLPEPEARRVLAEQVENYELQLMINDEAVTVQPADLGVDFAIDKTVDQALDRGRRAWLPAVGAVNTLLIDGEINYEISVDDQALQSYLDELIDQYGQAAENASLDFSQDQIVISPGQPGLEFDRERVRRKLMRSMAELEPEVRLELQETAPAITESELNEQVLQVARDKVGLALPMSVAGQTLQPSAEQIFSWLGVDQTEDGSLRLTVAEDKVAQYVETVAGQVNRGPEPRVVTRRGDEVVGVDEGRAGLRLQQEALADRLLQRLRTNQAGEVPVPTEEIAFETRYRDLPVRDQPEITYTYCISFRGVSRSDYYGAFSGKAAAVFNADQGWSLNGNIRYSEVSSGCDFTLWLASPQAVAGFAGYCSPQWSCRVGRNVIINVDRWNSGTQAWTASLAGYRTMVLNHELGHWLGLGHANCPSAGTPAPVMQQQSINLQGCQPNPWPTSGERQRLASNKGVTY